jgi:hypothetical protein
MLGTIMALKRAKAVMAAPQVGAICKVWQVSASISLDAGGAVHVSFCKEGKPIAFLVSEPGLMPWLIVRVASQYGPWTVLATSSVREASGALQALLEMGKK